jgi:hypothetical protein
VADIVIFVKYMNINFLIELLTNRLATLNLAKDQAFSAGDLERINALDAEMMGVQDTLSKLNMLLEATKNAATANSTLVEAMKLPINNVITDGSTECLDYYDIEPYATDPLHEQKIADILTAMGPMISPEGIDAYIDSEAISSPITGQMILDAAQTYEVDVRLMMALMELDSRFGTAGIAITTLNPGNVGNTGTSTRTYASWSDGVNAVAEWLNNHRKEAVEEVEEEEEEVEIPPIVPVATSTDPIIEATSTDPIIPPEATSTDPIIPPEATSTDPIIPPEATSTDPIITPPATTTDATSTPEVSATSTQARAKNKRVRV